jgi:hypothetical protein
MTYRPETGSNLFTVHMLNGFQFNDLQTWNGFQFSESTDLKRARI